MSNDDPRTVQYWKDRHIDPRLAADARLDEKPDWRVGDPAVVVGTRSGARYELKPDGTLSGGSKKVVGAHLGGASPRGSSMLRVKCVVVGLQMEFYWNGKAYGSSTVEFVRRMK